MKYNPNIHHRHSIRLKGYDYSQAGLYFITICVKDKECLFGEIVDGKMIINDAGIMVEKWYYELKNKYPDIECGEFVVMPNHFHCIIINNGMGNPVGQTYVSAPMILVNTIISNSPIKLVNTFILNNPLILKNPTILDNPAILRNVMILGNHAELPQPVRP